MKDKLFSTGGWIALELPARRKTLPDLADQLQTSGVAIEIKLETRANNENNRRLLNHIIGIERWGQSRLRVALGAPFVADEYNGYRPARETGWAELRRMFGETRAQTLEIAQELAAAGLDDARVLHNQWGELSPRAWLRYLNMHANMESDKLQKA